MINQMNSTVTKKRAGTVTIATEHKKTNSLNLLHNSTIIPLKQHYNRKNKCLTMIANTIINQ